MFTLERLSVEITVEGEPAEDKVITVEIEIHRESDLDGASKLHPCL